MPGDAQVALDRVLRVVTRIEFALAATIACRWTTASRPWPSSPSTARTSSPARSSPSAPTIGQEELARAVAEAAYRRGALFVDVAYFDPYVKRARIEHADPETLEFVPPWYAHRLEPLAERGRRADRARRASSHPDVLRRASTPRCSAATSCPWLKESARVISERATNWTIVPCPHPAWAKLVYPELDEAAAYERLWHELWHVLRLDEPDPTAAWDERDRAAASARPTALTERRFDALELRGPGHRADGRAAARRATWWAGDFTTRARPPPPAEPADRGGLHHARSARGRRATSRRRSRSCSRTARSSAACGCASRAAARSRSTPTRTAARSARRPSVDEGAARLGELALVDRQGRIGPLGTVFYDTLLDENAASHIALGFGFPFAVGERGPATASTTSGIHIDFMIGSPELEVTGVTADGERVPVLRGGDWQI